MTRLLLSGLVGVAVGVILWTVATASPTSLQVATRATRSVERQEIRAMPLLERPNRPGHFYGNTVRRMYSSPFSAN